MITVVVLGPHGAILTVPMTLLVTAVPIGVDPQSAWPVPEDG